MPRDNGNPIIRRLKSRQSQFLALIFTAALGPFTLLPYCFDVYTQNSGQTIPDAFRNPVKEIDPYKYPHPPVVHPWWNIPPPNATGYPPVGELEKDAKRSCANQVRHCNFNSECRRRTSLAKRCERRCQKMGYSGKWLPTSIFCRECKYAKKVPMEPCVKAAFRCRQSQLACTTKTLASIRTGHLKWFSMWDENKFRPDEFLGWANFGFSGNFTAIRNGAAYGFTHLFKVGQYFWERTDGYHSPLRLRADFKESWAGIYLEVRDLYEAGIIFGFCLGDELVWGGADWDMITKAADLLRHDFPGAVIWLNEAVAIVAGGCDHYHNCRNWTQLPASISWFGVDKYWTSDHFDHIDRVKGIYETLVYPKLWPHQSVVLVPGAFSSKRNTKCSQACYDNFCTKDASEFALWAAQDPRVAAITPYHWHYCAGCAKSKNEIGVIDMNSTKVMWQQIGRAIVQSAGASQNRTPVDVPLDIDAFLMPDEEEEDEREEIPNVKHKKQNTMVLGSEQQPSGDESFEKEDEIKSSDDEDVAPHDDAGAEDEGGDGVAGDLELPNDEGPDSELKELNLAEDQDESSGGEAYDEHVEKEKDY